MGGVQQDSTSTCALNSGETLMPTSPHEGDPGSSCAWTACESPMHASAVAIRASRIVAFASGNATDAEPAGRRT